MTMTSSANPSNGNPERLGAIPGFAFDGAVPEAWRSLAGTAVNQTREAYEHSKSSLEAGLHAVEKSCDAAGQAVAALNRKILEIAQRNIDSGFDLARSLASAKNLAEVVELQGAHWRKHFETLLSQAEEVRKLSVEATSDVAEPIRQHAKRQAEEAQALSKRMTAETASVMKRQANKIEEEMRRRAS
jgi:phasin